MTMLTEIKETYEPTVQDKIQRILYRLDHGETLIKNALYNGENYCILGLFAEESGLGEWNRNEGESFRYHIPGCKEHSTHALTLSIKDYYGFASCYGDFYVGDLPEYVRNRLQSVINFEIGPEISLMEINDIAQDTPDNIALLMSDIIKSGAVFKQG